MNVKTKIDHILGDKSKIKSYDEIVKIGTKHPFHIKIERYRGNFLRMCPNVISKFDYGEIPDMINPADYMGWDVMISPSSKSTDNNLLISGVVKIKPDANKIPFPLGNIPGNHKLILSQNGILSDEDKRIFIDYFSPLQPFETPIFFEKEKHV